MTDKPAVQKPTLQPIPDRVTRPTHPDPRRPDPRVKTR